MTFNLKALLYVFVLLAAGLATFEFAGLAVVAMVLALRNFGRAFLRNVMKHKNFYIFSTIVIAVAYLLFPRVIGYALRIGIMDLRGMPLIWWRRTTCATTIRNR